MPLNKMSCMYDSDEDWKFLVLNTNLALGNIFFSKGNAGAIQIVVLMKI